jgi:hypothetical protein
MTRPTVIVSGAIAGAQGQGGAVWAVLQYLLGFQRLGWEVVFVEPHDLDRPWSRSTVRACSAVLDRHGVPTWALVDPTSGETAGLDRTALKACAAAADLLINVSGMLTDPDVLDHVPVRAYLDLDPAFVQLWHDIEGIDMRLDGHSHFVSIADVIGDPGCPIPTCGREWIPTLPPVALDEWPVAGAHRDEALTTVANWRGYGSIDHDGIRYGQKAHSWRPFTDLPARSGHRFAPALAIHRDETDDVRALREGGWTLLDPAVVAATTDDYRDFVRGSWAELAIAKSGYVLSGSGWFSDRSACYLASGRPVIAQDTGFTRRLPTGQGLFAFADSDDVIAALDELRADYEAHRHGARRIAEEHLESDGVLTALLARLGP